MALRHLKNWRYVERDQQNHGAAKTNAFDEAMERVRNGGQKLRDYGPMVP